MLALLQWIYGPGAESDPYYLLLHDFVVLMPWWYPYMWIGILTAVFGWRALRRLRRSRQNRAGLRRVRARLQHLAETPAVPVPWVPAAANDDYPLSAARRQAT